MDLVQIYTDGACLKNPHGPGGFGTVLLFEAQGKIFKKELSGGFNGTTNNRMEMMAVIRGLEALKSPCKVVVYSDSKYVVNAIEKKWVNKWKKFGWRKSINGKEKPKNIDLWKRMLSAMETHNVSMVWVKGHAGNHYNEICDRLAGEAARQKNLPQDAPPDEDDAPASLF